MTPAERFPAGSKVRIIGCGVRPDQKWCKLCYEACCVNRLCICIVNRVTTGMDVRVHTISGDKREGYKYLQNVEPVLSRRFLDHKAELCKE